MQTPKHWHYRPKDFRKLNQLRKKLEMESYGLYPVYGDNERCCSYCGNRYFTMYIDEPVSLCAQCAE